MRPIASAGLPASTGGESGFEALFSQLVLGKLDDFFTVHIAPI
jgi:hypothetical protein